MIMILAVVCSMATGECHEELITTTEIQPGLGISACYNEPAVADWFKREYPTGYILKNWRCKLGAATTERGT